MTTHRMAAPLALVATTSMLWSSPVLAYIGPGAGITLLGALWAVLVAIGLAIGAVVLWPFRVLLRRRRKRADKAAGNQTPPANKSS